jgi:Spy/CpxP family protein refolding chaperone
MAEERKMTETSETRFKNRSRAQIIAIILGVVVITGALCWGAESVAAQWRPRNLTRAAKSFQRGQPPVRAPQRQIKKLNPNPAKDGGRGNNPNQRPALLKEFSPEELELVPLGIDRPAPLLYVFRQLNLSGEQKTKLRNLVLQIGKQIVVARGLQRAHNIALDEALYAHNFDPKLVEQRAAELANAQAELIKAQARVMSQIRQILTPEQAARFRELLDEERRRLNQVPPQDQSPPDKSK